ncbi:MAG: glutamate 5-kinase [Myxococcales bacterium]|nr:glutamate 5-kinase [Myxococcales bacterium]
MSAKEEPRAGLSAARRIVVKIGSRAIVAGPGGHGRFQQLADESAALMARGCRVALVSSGAVAMGRERLGLNQRPDTTPMLQATAAVGQARLVQAYERAFMRHDIPVAQVLLTHAGLVDRARYLNARHAIDALFEIGAVPVINENDTVSTEEIEFGDNDQLAAMVASLVGADLLVLLTDVDGLLDEKQRRVPLVEDVGRVHSLIWEQPQDMSLGGMGSKVGAAERALARGLPVVIAPASDPRALQRIVDGEDVGTLFLPRGAKLASRKYWIAYTLRPRGTLRVDAGAARAIVDGKRSLLAAGITAVEGDFRPGDAVRICDSAGLELARGLSRYEAREVGLLLGVRSDEIEERLGRHGGDEIVHRDDLVVL